MPLPSYHLQRPTFGASLHGVGEPTPSPRPVKATATFTCAAPCARGVAWPPECSCSPLFLRRAHCSTPFICVDSCQLTKGTPGVLFRAAAAACGSLPGRGRGPRARTSDPLTPGAATSGYLRDLRGISGGEIHSFSLFGFARAARGRERCGSQARRTF